MEDDGAKARESVDFLFEMGHLKRTPRSGWGLARATGESVSDHSHRAAIVAMILASMEGVNVDRAAMLALLHDTPESRLGDFNHLTQIYVKDSVDQVEVIEDQTRDLPTNARETIRARFREWDMNSSPEARIAHDADVIESMLHISETLSHRKELKDRWLNYLAPHIKTQAGMSLATEINDADPDSWWTSTVENGRRPREQ